MFDQLVVEFDSAICFGSFMHVVLGIPIGFRLHYSKETPSKKNEEDEVWGRRGKRQKVCLHIAISIVSRIWIFGSEAQNKREFLSYWIFRMNQPVPVPVPLPIKIDYGLHWSCQRIDANTIDFLHQQRHVYRFSIQDWNLNCQLLAGSKGRIVCDQILQQVSVLIWKYYSIFVWDSLKRTLLLASLVLFWSFRFTTRKIC